MYPYPYSGAAPTMPSNTGAPLYSYHRTGPRPGSVGSCEIIAGNRVCSGAPAAYGYGHGGPVGAMVVAPLGAVVAAPFAAVGAMAAPTVVGSGETIAPLTGTPVYSYESHVGPQPGAVGHCDLISGNRVCVP